MKKSILGSQFQPFATCTQHLWKASKRINNILCLLSGLVEGSPSKLHFGNRRKQFPDTYWSCCIHSNVFSLLKYIFRMKIAGRRKISAVSKWYIGLSFLKYLFYLIQEDTNGINNKVARKKAGKCDYSNEIK